MKLKIYLMGLLCLFFRVSARDNITFSGLSIGDHVPDIPINNIINYKSTSLKISDFKGKVLVLDFWATWCSACVNNLPGLSALQKQIPAKLQVLLVDSKSTRDKEENILRFFALRKGYDQLPSVMLDTMLRQLFPHSSIPHEVWIIDNTVVAITDASGVTKENVDLLLNKQKLNFNTTSGEENLNNKPLVPDTALTDLHPLIYHSVLLPFRRNAKPIFCATNGEQGLVSSIRAVNQSRLDLIVASCPEFSLIPDRILLKVPEQEMYSLDNVSAGWQSQNSFCYESAFPLCSKTAAFAHMRSDMETYLNVKISLVERSVDCMVLTLADSAKITNGVKKSRSDSNISEEVGAPIFFANYPLSSVCTCLEDYLGVPFVNETGYRRFVDLALPRDKRNAKLFAGAFAKQGFTLSKQMRTITFLMISDANGNEK